MNVISLDDHLEAQPGTYILVLQAQQPATINVGRAGMMEVQPGCYLYTGSAFGPGGLRGRLAHHLRPVVRPHWHIDYLRQETSVVEIWAFVGATNLEHDWAKTLYASPLCAVPMPRFGASDCRCRAHLVFCQARPELTAFQWSGRLPEICKRR